MISLMLAPRYGEWGYLTTLAALCQLHGLAYTASPTGCIPASQGIEQLTEDGSHYGLRHAGRSDWQYTPAGAAPHQSLARGHPAGEAGGQQSRRFGQGQAGAEPHQERRSE